MTWGLGWGVGPWGGVAAPVLDAVASDLGVLDVLGGDVLTIFGANFSDPMVAEVLLSGNVVGTCYVFDPRYDVLQTKMYVGTPALAKGTYDLRVTSIVGTSTLMGALVYEPIADQLKAERARVGFASPWISGRRFLRGGV